MTHDELLAQIAELGQHRALDAFYAQLERVITQLGFRQYLFSVIPDQERGIDIRDMAIQPAFSTSFNAAWADYYLDRRYQQYDMVVHHCLDRRNELCIWQQSFREKPLTALQKTIYLEANDAGCTNGITVPLRNHLGVLGVLSLTFEGSETQFAHFFAERKAAMLIFAEAFNQAILDNFMPHFTRSFQPQMTQRERDVLHWLARGCTNDQIADKLEVGVFTVRKHITQAMRKLGARNATQAVALAIKWRIIR